MAKLNPRAQLELLKRGTVEVISDEALLARLELGRPLRVKLGVDPTSPDLHLGNAIVLRKLRQFQDLGHEAILVIGDFTGLIGDPSGKSETRPALTPEEIQANAKTYREQYGLILDPQRTRVVFNSQWLRPMTFHDVITLASRATVHRILERDDFAKRFREHLPIHVHELLYPLCQAYDSVHIQADVELGGTDQKFNNLMGRELQREMGQDPQVVLLTPLLPGLDGVQKMSKSLGNAIGITEPPGEMFGKVMSLPDAQMIPYFEYCTLVPLPEVRQLADALRAGAAHPRDVKKRLAREITTLYHGAAAAGAAEQEFDRVFREGEQPREVPKFFLDPGTVRADLENKVHLEHLLVAVNMAESYSEARRLISQGGVRISDFRLPQEENYLINTGRLEKRSDRGYLVKLPTVGPGGPIVDTSGLLIRVGPRRIARVWLRV